MKVLQTLPLQFVPSFHIVFMVTRLWHELKHPPGYETLTAHRLQGRHLLQVQTNRDRTSLWALVFTIIAACCSQGNLNLNNQYLKRHKPFPWEPGKSAGDLTWPFSNASVLSSPPFWVTNAVPFRELAWKITWI